MPSTLLLVISMFATCLGECFLAPAENKRLECSNLPAFPRGTEPVQVLRATNNTFIKIASNSFRANGFAALRAALLRHGRIEAVDERALNAGLVLLDLTGNRLEELQMDAFEGVKVLVLARNRLRRIHGGASSLLFLDLSRNNLTGIRVDLLTGLKYLDVSRNPLDFSEPFRSDSLAVLRVSLRGKIAPDFFAGLRNLQVLELSGDYRQWTANLLRPLSKLRVLYVDKPLNEEKFVPASVEKFVQAEMGVTSDAFVSQILLHIDEVDAGSKDVEFLQYLEDDVLDEFVQGKSWSNFLKKCLLFSLLVYLSLMYTVCLSQVAKSLIYKPYQRLYVDEI